MRRSSLVAKRLCCSRISSSRLFDATTMTASGEFAFTRDDGPAVLGYGLEVTLGARTLVADGGTSSCGVLGEPGAGIDRPDDQRRPVGHVPDLQWDDGVLGLRRRHALSGPRACERAPAGVSAHRPDAGGLRHRAAREDDAAAGARSRVDTRRPRDVSSGPRRRDAQSLRLRRARARAPCAATSRLVSASPFAGGGADGRAGLALHCSPCRAGSAVASASPRASIATATGSPRRWWSAAQLFARETRSKGWRRGWDSNPTFRLGSHHALGLER